MTWAAYIKLLLPWTQLTVITLRYETSISRWVEVMSMCPRLHYCSVHINDEFPGLPCSPNGIHRSLRKLLFTFSDGVPFLKLLSLYQLPSPYMLLVRYNTQPPSDFLHPSPASISALVNIRHFSLSRGCKLLRKHITHLANILREMVNLEKFELQQTANEFIPLYSALSFNRQRGPILPRLRTLLLWVSSIAQCKKDNELQPLLNALSSRSREDTIPVGFKPLECFILQVADEDIYERMKKLFDPWVGGLPS